jgi:hypothetical protein
VNDRQKLDHPPREWQITHASSIATIDLKTLVANTPGDHNPPAVMSATNYALGRAGMMTTPSDGFDIVDRSGEVAMCRQRWCWRTRRANSKKSSAGCSGQK